MGYILIAIGIAAIIGGIAMLSRSAKPESSVSEVPMDSVIALSVDTVDKQESLRNQDALVENQSPIQATPIPTSSSASATAQTTKSDAELSAKEKGNLFEDFVANLLADHRLRLLERTQDAVSSAGVVAESCKNPDLHVQQKRGKSTIDYYLECKYRSNWTEDVVTFQDWQIKRYRQFQRDHRRKVIIALGVGGTPAAPATLRIVPIDSLNNNSIKKIDTQYAIQPTSSALIEYMDDYFTTVFQKAKNRKTE